MLRLRRPMISCFAVATVAFPAVLSRRRMTTMRAPQRRALIIDTDAGADDLATLAAAAAAEAPLRLVTTSSGLSPPGHGHLLVRRTLDALGLSQVRVVAGAERPPAYLARAKADWEVDYGPRLDGVVTGCGVEPVTAEQAQDTGSAAAAADAIIETATAAGGGATILALGALTNVAAAWERQPEAFARSVERVVFIGDTQDVPSYNVALDPLAMQTVLRSGVELVLVGHSCFPSPAWVEALFADAPAASLDGGSEAPDAPDAGAAVPAEPAEPSATAAAMLRRLGSLDAYSMCYDPLALLYHLEPDAFVVEGDDAGGDAEGGGGGGGGGGGDNSGGGGGVTPVRVQQREGVWHFEACAEAEAGGHAREPSGVALQRYGAFLTRLSGIRNHK